MENSGYKKSIYLYLDESGERQPHIIRDVIPPWFSMGGILVHEDQKEDLEKSVYEFKMRWKIENKPLHCVEIRKNLKDFNFLKDNKIKKAFLKDLRSMFLSFDVKVVGTVINRSGYIEKYKGCYPDPWLCCKTAFCITMERAVKYAIQENCNLIIRVEHVSDDINEKIIEYYKELKNNGMTMFNESNSGKYNPLKVDDFKVLKDIDIKPKQNVCMQIADLVIRPISKIKYPNKNNQLTECLRWHEVKDKIIPYPYDIKYSQF